MEMNRFPLRQFSFAAIPRAMRRVLLLGVPSLALLGLFGFAGWKWLTRTRRKQLKTAPETSAQDGGDGHATPDSGVDEGRSSESSPLESDAKMSCAPFSAHRERPEELPSELPVHPLYRPAQTLRSVPEERQYSEGFKSPAAWKYPTTSSDVLAENISDPDSLVSSEGLLSIPPVNYESSANPSPVPLVSSSFAADCQVLPAKHGLVQSSSSAPMLTGASGTAPRPDAPPFEMHSRSTPNLFFPHERVRVVIQIPRDLVGRFIGKQGRNIKALMADSSGTHIYVNQKNIPKDAVIVPCHVQGNSQQVEQALHLIADKFPDIELPSHLDSESFTTHPPVPSPLFGTPGHNGESWDVELKPAVIPTSQFKGMVSYIENLNHLWLVTCSGNSVLDELHQSMSYTYCYASVLGNSSVQVGEEDSELLGKYCAVRVSDIHWLRGQISKFGEDGGNYEVQLVDYGSMVVVPSSAIRPLR